MIEKDHTLFGTKIKNNQTGKIGLLIYTWLNVYADEEVLFATCVDTNGKKYNISMDDITPIEEGEEDCETTKA